MLLISLTGGIGVGKSTAASLLKQRGAQVLVLDEVARTILDPGTSATWEVSQIWPSVVRDGFVDRAALAKIVFGDPEALAQLNAITHPRTWQAAERILEGWDASGDAEVAVIEIAILANSPRKFSSHLNVVIGADTDVRLERLEGRGLTRDEALARMNNQRPQADLADLADAWLDNSGVIGDLAAQISQLWEERLAPYAANLAAHRRIHGLDRHPEPAEVQRCVARLKYYGIQAKDEGSGNLTASQPTDGRALSAAGFVPGEGCFELADPAYQLTLS